MVLTRLERSKPPEEIDCYILDLIKHRDISNKLAQEYDVYHESPQVLLIKNGECVYDESHYGITMDAVIEQV
jgi:bacillithiol system protein YtxJ